MSSARNIQIVQAYEQIGMTPEQIAEHESISLLEVKSVLLQGSPAYRKLAQTDKNLDFSDDELEAANQVLVQLMNGSEDENLKYRCAKYIRDDKKGRKDRISQFGKLNINVLQINGQLAQVNKVLERTRAMKSLEPSQEEPKPAPAPVIDVESNEQQVPTT